MIRSSTLIGTMTRLSRAPRWIKQFIVGFSSPDLDLACVFGLLMLTRLPTVRSVFATGRSNPIHRLRGHRDEVNVVKFSPCGTLVATCSDDHTVRIWSLRNLPALASTIDKKSVKKGDESRKIDIEDEAGCLVLEGHESEVHQISWKPGCGKEGTEKDGNRLIAS